jgi:Protein of unknown function (DUF2997)
MLQRLTLLVCTLLLLDLSQQHVTAFSVAVSSAAGSSSRAMSSWLRMANSWDGTGGSGSGGAGASGGGAIEQIEFKIYADGRVEETVRGVKGNSCHKVTEKINESLGQVVATVPTEEMFEQQVVVNEKLYQTDSSSSSDWNGGSTW